MHAYFRSIVRLSTHFAYRVLTVSEFSKQELVNWAKLDESKVVVVGNGVALEFTSEGDRYQPGYDYLLYVGNCRSHKNVTRLLTAFAQAGIDPGIRLLLSGNSDSVTAQLVHELKFNERVIFAGFIPEIELPSYYRGALALVYPSLYEGFGLPPLESMACGTPVLTSNVTSLPEVVGDASIMVDPYNVEAIAHGIERIVEDKVLRNQLQVRCLNQAKKFTWERTAKLTQQVLEQAINQ